MVTPVVASNYADYSYVLNVITIYEYICTRVNLYTMIICTDDMTIDVCLHMSLGSICVVCHWLFM